MLRMNTHIRLFIYTLVFSILSPSALHCINYSVQFEGVLDTDIQKQLKDSSITYEESDKPVPNYQVLKKRAEEDLERLNQVAQYFGYLGARSSFSILKAQAATVVFRVDLGPLFLLKEYKTIGTSEASTKAIAENITLEKLHLDVNSPASTKNINDAETYALSILKNNGYPYCAIAGRKTVADLANHQAFHAVVIDTGPFIRFGKISITGSQDVKSEKILKSIFWKNGGSYSQDELQATQSALEATGLFSAVTIHEQLQEDNTLDIHIDLKDAPHKTIGAGISYMTAKGVGVGIDWEHRNVGHLGDKFSIRSELWAKFQTVVVSLAQQNLKSPNENLTWFAEYNKQQLRAYKSQALSVGGLFDRQLSKQKDLIYGLKFEDLRSSSDGKSNLFYLAKIPLGFKINESNNLLDPTKGYFVNIRLTPAYQFKGSNFGYIIHSSTVAFFHSIFKDKVTFAAKANLGNIFGAAEYTIPIPDRFFSGSESALRGYRYQTVSPTNSRGELIGGRSVLTGSLETRFRTKSNIGWVLFYDVGNVYRENLPVLSFNQLHSVGIGGRYSTPIGPLRIDIAFPLNRRKKFDAPFQLYFSIGQSF